MNLRWLVGNFTDPQYKISWREQVRLSNRAHSKHLPKRVFLLYTMVMLIPISGLLAILKPSLSTFGLAGQNKPYIIGLAAIVLISWPWCAWIYRTMYVKPIRRVMREAGHILCINCGYDLRELPDSVVRCPECGAKRDSLPPTQGEGTP